MRLLSEYGKKKRRCWSINNTQTRALSRAWFLCFSKRQNWWPFATVVSAKPFPFLGVSPRLLLGLIFHLWALLEFLPIRFKFNRPKLFGLVLSNWYAPVLIQFRFWTNWNVTPEKTVLGYHISLVRFCDHIGSVLFIWLSSQVVCCCLVTKLITRSGHSLLFILMLRATDANCCVKQLKN